MVLSTSFFLHKNNNYICITCHLVTRGICRSSHFCHNVSEILGDGRNINNLTIFTNITLVHYVLEGIHGCSWLESWFKTDWVNIPNKAECLVMTLTVTFPISICNGIEKVMILLLYHLHLDRVVKVTQ